MKGKLKEILIPIKTPNIGKIWTELLSIDSFKSSVARYDYNETN